jgi:hypothetical protein
MENTAAAQATPSTMLYLFADRLVPKGNLLNGTIVPGTDTRVQMKEFIGELVVAALRYLRDQGDAKVELIQTGFLFIKGHDIQITPLRAAAIGGLEGMLLKYSGTGATMTQTLKAMFGPSPTIYQGLNTIAFKSAMEHGYLRTAGGGAGDVLSKIVSGAGKAERVPEAFATLEPLYEGFAADWNTFKQKEAQFFETAVKAIQASIKALAPVDTHSLND